MAKTLVLTYFTQFQSRYHPPKESKLHEKSSPKESKLAKNMNNYPTEYCLNINEVRILVS